jgi:CO/xanthine dehydrogenase FAD-binding subunit
VNMRDSHLRPKTLMDLGRLEELRGVRVDDGYVVVGGGTTIAALLTDSLVAEHGAPLRQAAAALGNPLVRNRATLAGNLVDASPAADTAPPLLVLNAEVELASQERMRRLPLEDFIVGPNETLLQPQELLVAVRWPVPPPDSVGAFYKIGLRKASACSVVNAAIMVGTELVSAPRIALGAVAPRPIRVHAVEDMLRGQSLTPKTIAQAARLAAEATSPIDDIRGSAEYRRRAAEALVRRLLTEVKSTE